MNNRLILIAGFLMSTLPATTIAQADRQTTQQSSPAQTRDPAADLEKWLTRPTLVRLGASQRKTVDSLKAAFAAESKQLMGATNDEMAIISRTGDLLVKYRRLIANILSDSQRRVYEDNLVAARFPMP